MCEFGFRNSLVWSCNLTKNWLLCVNRQSQRSYRTKLLDSPEVCKLYSPLIHYDQNHWFFIFKTKSVRMELVCLVWSKKRLAVSNMKLLYTRKLLPSDVSAPIWHRWMHILKIKQNQTSKRCWIKTNCLSIKPFQSERNYNFELESVSRAFGNSSNWWKSQWVSQTPRGKSTKWALSISISFIK